MVRPMRHLVLLALLGACGDDGGSSAPIDAPPSIDAPAAQTCTGACRTTALDASLTFAAGTITGHIYATHCDSLDETQ